MIEAATDHPAFGRSYQAVLAAAYAQAGRLDDARSILTTFSSNNYRDVRRNQLWLTDMTALAETADILGHQAAAAAIAEQLQPFTGRVAALSTTVVSTVDLVLAQMALVTGDHQRARRHAEQAVSASRERKTPLFLGRELLRLAAARRHLGEAQTPHTTSYTRRWPSQTEPARPSSSTKRTASASSTNHAMTTCPGHDRSIRQPSTETDLSCLNRSRTGTQSSVLPNLALGGSRGFEERRPAGGTSGAVLGRLAQGGKARSALRRLGSGQRMPR